MWCEPVICSTGRCTDAGWVPPRSNVAHSLSPRQASSTGLPNQSSRSVSNFATSASRLTTCVIVRWNDSCHVACWPGWHERHAREPT
jgi:hypothetical protein